MIQSRNTPTPGLPKLPPHHLHRPQLQAKLTDSDANLIALIAPAGYGKSVTLIDHALNANRSSAWVKVNPNLPRLVKATLNALHAIGLSGIGLSGIGLSDIGLESDPEDALEASLEQLETGIDLLFDGIDDLEPAANTWLLKLAQRLPDGHRLLLTARDAEHLRLERLTAEGRGELITAHDLAFAPGEGQSYLAARGLEPFDDLIDRLEGWPLALALAAAQIKNPSQTSSFTPEALLPEWLERLPFDVRSGLPEASVLEVWSEADAKEIGSTLPAGWLLEARRAGLPVVPNIDGASFVPHASLRQCLARQLLERPDRHRALHEAAIQSAIEAERFADAVRHALAAGLEERALEIAYGCAYIVSSRFNHRDFREIFKQFPTDAIEPQWRAWYAISLVYTGAATKGVSLLNTMRNKGEAVPQVLFGLLLVAFNEDRIDFQNALLAEADELDLKPEWRARFERNKVRQFLHAGSYQLALVQLLTLRDQAQKLGNQYAEDPPPTSNTWTPT